jgi:hypothetical protein
MTTESLSKLDAATRQLHLAIDLYFREVDPLGVHTLVGAAHGLLTHLIVHKRRRKDAVAQTSHIQPDRIRFVSRMVTEAKNLLKLADLDQENILQFDSNWTDFLLLEAIALHIELTGDVSRPNSFFLLWVSAKYPDVLSLDDIVGKGISELRRIFPELVSPKAQKRTFLHAMSGERSSDVDSV